MDNKINIMAPIIPSIGAAGIKILENAYPIVREALDNIQSFTPAERQVGNWEHYSLFPASIVYSYNKIVDFYIDICSGLITLIAINPGYLGLLWDEIKIGDKFSRLLNIRNDIEIDDNKIRLIDEPNIIFELDYDEDFDPPNDLEECTIQKIWLENSKFNFQTLNFYYDKHKVEIWKAVAIKALNEI